MSRIGRKSIPLPKGVTIGVDGTKVTAKGTKGWISVDIPEGVAVSQEEDGVSVTVADPTASRFWGLSRTLVANAIEGVSNGFHRRLLVVGVGYRVEAAGSRLTLHVGYSHPVVVQAPEGVTFAIEQGITIPCKKDSYPATPLVVQGIDKQAVGDIAAKVRSVRPPDPYLWKGIRYEGERMRTDKAGKTAK